MWAFQGAASDGATSTSDTSLVVTAPAGSGGQLIAVGICGSARTLSPPAGWTSALSGGGSVRRVYVWHRDDDAAGTYTFTVSGTFNDASVSVLRYSGIDLSTLSATAAESTGSDTTAECPSITTGVANELVIWACGVNNGLTATINNGATERVDYAGAANGSAVSVYDSPVDTACTPAASVISLSGYGRWVACSIEVAETGGGTRTLTDNLSGYWKLDESSGNRADSHGSNTLTDNNTVGSATGILGTAADFEDGSSEYLSCASNSTLQATLGITISCWVKLESKGSGDIQIVSKDTDTGREYTLFYRSSSDRFGFSRLDLITDTLANNFGAPSTGVWYHLVGWYDPATGEQGIAVNGTVNTATATAWRKTGTSAEFRIGARQYPGFPGYFDGLIDEVLFAQRVYTSTERATLYGAGTPPAYPFTAAAGYVVPRRQPCRTLARW